MGVTASGQLTRIVCIVKQEFCEFGPINKVKEDNLIVHWNAVRGGELGQIVWHHMKREPPVGQVALEHRLNGVAEVKCVSCYSAVYRWVVASYHPRATIGEIRRDFYHPATPRRVLEEKRSLAGSLASGDPNGPIWPQLLKNSVNEIDARQARHGDRRAIDGARNHW